MNTKKGISLIVLVITIIVMIILASTIIINLTNNGIIDSAEKAVEDMELANARTLANTAWSSAYIAGNATKEDLEREVKDKLEENHFDLDKYTVIVTTEGVTVEKSNFWILEKTKVGSKVTSAKIIKGRQKIDVGAVVNYAAPSAKGYSGTWKILGVDEQGRIKLVSTESIGSKSINGKTGYKTAVSELNTMCGGYADGVKAETSRSITLEDIDELTAFNKTKYGANQLEKYGNSATYSWDASGNTNYTATNGLTGKLNTVHLNGFTYYDEITKDFVTKAKNTNGEITTLINNYYNYSVSTYLDSTTEAYKMIFKNATGTNNAPAYWLASSFVWLGTYNANFGVFNIEYGGISYYNIVTSNGYELNIGSGCRAVVILKPDISLTANGETGTYNIT